MAIGVYDRASFSQYTPLSAQEILMPASMMRERHDKLDEEYAAINDELQKVAFIAEHENDPAIKQQYSNYMNSLSQGRDELMSRGLNSSSKRRMLDLRGKFQSEIQPINLGYQMKVQDVNNYNQMIAKDPTYIGQDPSQRTVSDYINNGLQPFNQQGISGSMVTKMAADYLSPFSKELTDTDLKNLLTTMIGKEEVPQYMEYIQKHGYKPGTEGHKKLMELATDRVLSSTGVSSWASPEQLAQIQGYVNLAESQTIGQETSKTLNNNAWAIAMQKQQAKEAAQAADTQLSGFNKQPGQAEAVKKRLDEVQNEYEGVINYANSGRLTGWDAGNDYKRTLYGKANEVQKDIANMNDSEIDEYFKKNKFSYFFRGGDVPFSGGKKDKTDELKKQAKALKEYNSYQNLQKEIAKEQGLTVEQAQGLAQSYLDSTSILYGTVYTADSEALDKGQQLALASTKANMFNNNQTQVYVDGEKKSMKDIPKELRSKILTKGQILGHNIYNPSTGLSTVAISYTPEDGEKDAGKVYRVEVPDVNLSDRYKDSRKVLQTIQNSNTYLPKPITLSGGIEATVYSEPSVGGWQHYIQIGNDKVPVEEFIERFEQGRVKTDFYNRSLNPAQLKYNQSGVIPQE